MRLPEGAAQDFASECLGGFHVRGRIGGGEREAENELSRLKKLPMGAHGQSLNRTNKRPARDATRVGIPQPRLARSAFLTAELCLLQWPPTFRQWAGR